MSTIDEYNGYILPCIFPVVLTMEKMGVSPIITIKGIALMTFTIFWYFL